ncbi:VRR-NUC domain-containing protein [Pseudomonas cichorii]|uniref:VRR-NUC domain-containing protein n=1 Tax=Pseudomonas cichorii TaxID=36746 RepID=UPI001C8AA253|nr:VRR-NUC domain-containing protein [Pseudomonas cichorii]MBX8488039.1 VRR-NUC domain-containing protein [Pseudomonas cichorii]MBX8575209.1 VRR-NUC domain-containing protein [Pseudomonas cichorii]
MAVMQPPQAPQTPQSCTNTSIEGTVKEAPLPNPDNKPYLMEKANYASRFPKLSIKKTKDGGVTGLELKQLVMSGLIRADEYRRDFLWDYKAEVCFDMAFLPPKPFLSSSFFGENETLDPLRRHTLFPFPKNSVKGLLRRPDVIIVKNRSIRWPGQAGPDHQGVAHPNNLERLVEVKFPGDKLYPEQERAYLLIAGGRGRFSVLEISDCRDDDERERDRQYNREHKPTGEFNPLQWPSILPGRNPDEAPRPAPVPVPAYGPTATPRPAHVESWTQQVQSAVDGLLEQGAEGIRQLSQEIQQHLEDAATWLGIKGDWVRRESQKAWDWVSETGAQIVRWTDDQLRAAWKEIQRYTDITLEMLRQIDWVQVLIDVGVVVATVVVAFAIGAAVVAAGIPAALVAALLVIIRLAQASWALLATILGGATVTATATAG